MSPKIQAEKCKTPDCNNPVYNSRGVCKTCYATAQQIVSEGKATWEQLEDLKLVLPTGYARNKFRIAFNNKAKRK